jgi:hypothetical protein
MSVSAGDITDPFSFASIEDSTLFNLRVSVIVGYSVASSFPTYPLPSSFALSSSVAGYGVTYQDSVYKYTSSIATANDWVSTSYLLVTTAIDAGIAALPTATPADVARKNYIVSLRAQINTFFSAANYAQCINYIQYIEVILSTLSIGSDNIVSSLSLLTPTQLNTVVDAYAPGQLDVLQGGWYNLLTNTLTNVQYNYTWNWTLPLGGNYTITNPTNYPDGVYLNYVSEIWAGLLFSSDPESRIAFLFEGQSYELVTTFISEQISIFEENYNPNDPNQVSLLEELQENFALIQTYFDDEDYEGTNDQIVIVETLLENVNVCAGLSMVLASGTTNQMVLTYPSLPAGTYSEQTGTLINSITGEEYTFTGFPANSSNTQLTLNSNDIGAGSSFADGVWQVSNTFVNVATYQCTAYALVVTNARCCVRKAQAKSATCRNLTGRAEELSSWLETAIDEFNYSAYSVSNGFIKKINAVCSSCGCGC